MGSLLEKFFRSQTIEVKAIYVYPVKSCAGISLKEADVETGGIKHDRSFFLVNDKHQLVTARSIPACVRILPELKSDSLTLIDLDGNMDPYTLSLPINKETTSSVNTTIWRREAQGLDCGDDAAAWLENKLGKKIRLVKSIKKMAISEDVKYRSLAKQGDQSNAQDLTSFHILSTSTIDSLSKGFGKDIDHRRFRPNILISGCSAYDEDLFQIFSIGKHLFHQTKLCNRCTFPAINPDSAVRDPSLIKFMRKARCGDYKFPTSAELGEECFVGIQCGHTTSEGPIKVGQKVKIISVAFPKAAFSFWTNFWMSVKLFFWWIVPF